MKNEIKETLEELERKLQQLKEKHQKVGDYKKSIPLEVIKFISALSTAITWGKALEEAGEELGEKINAEDLNGCSYGVNAAEAMGYNQMHSIAPPNHSEV